MLACVIGALSTPAAAPAGVTTFPLPTPFSTPLAITRGPDGAVWFTEIGTNTIGRITADGLLKEFQFQPYFGEAMQDFNGITAGPDGALWFTETNINWIGRVTTAGAFRHFLVRDPDQDPEDPYIPGTRPTGITTGPDGAIWFGQEYGNRIARLDPATGKVTDYYQFPVEGWPRLLQAITTGPDGALWFTEGGSNSIGRLTTSGSLTEYPIPTPLSAPGGITTGPDGALWFTEAIGRIGRITTSGAVREFRVRSADADPLSITVGSDGALWFTEQHAGRIGRITTAGEISEVDVGPGPKEIASGGDGALWFTDNDAIGRITTDTPPSSGGCDRGKGHGRHRGYRHKKHC